MRGDPKRVRALGGYVPVAWKDNLKDENGDPLYGCVNDGVIEMDTSCTHEQRRSKLLHEVCHHMADSLGYDWPESLVLQVETIMFAIIRDNPSIVRWVMAREQREKG